MEGAGSRIWAALRAGAAFTAEAWRDAWAPLSLLACGQAATFIAGHAGLPTTLANRLQMAGWGVSAVVLLPALGALYRSAAGGKPLKGIQRGGLQLGDAEGRIARITLGAGVCLFLMLAAMAGVAVAARIALGGAGLVRLPMIGAFAGWFVAAMPVFAMIAVAGYLFLGRLSLAYPAAVAEGRVDLGRALRLSRRWPGGVAAALVFAELVPIGLTVGAARLLETLEQGWAQSAGLTAWPLLDASVAGAVLALVTAFVILPLGVGARTGLYARGLAEERADARRRAPIEARAAEALAEAEAALAEEPPETEAVVEVEAVEVPPPVPTEEESMAALQAKLEEAAERMEAAGGARAYADGWRPPVAPLRMADIAQRIGAPVLLTHANDRIPDPRWWSPPEHPEEPPVA